MNKNIQEMLSKNENAFRECTVEMRNLYKKKNHDYGNSFGETFKKLGLVSAVTRINDKFNRLCTLSTGEEQQVKSETIRDTLLDMANYCVMTIIELDRENLEKEQETQWERIP